MTTQKGRTVSANTTVSATRDDTVRGTGGDAVQYQRGDPLPTVEAVRQALECLLGSANQRQVWLFCFGTNGAIVDPIMPFDDFPATPSGVVYAEDLGWVSCARVFSTSIRDIVEMVGAASCGLVWERRGSARLAPAEAAWASDLARHLADEGVTLRAQFLLHNAGLSEVVGGTEVHA